MQNAHECYELTLTANYVSDWTFNDAMRELIQNGIDQEVLDPGNKFDMQYDSSTQILRLISPKSKLSVNTLLLGKSSKSNNEDTVGQFGEGYKIAALVLNRLGKTFTIYNNEKKQVWNSRFKNSPKWLEKILAFYVSTNEPTERGLVIEVGNVDSYEYDCLEDVWINFEDRYEEIEKIHTQYGDIITDEYYKGKVFVSGLAIDYGGSLDFGYNFKPQYIKLERDRKTCDGWNAKIITSKMISEALINGDISPETVTKMVEEDTDDIYQMDIIEESGYLKKVLIEEFDRQNTKPFSIPVGSEEQSKRVKALGGNPVFVQHRVAKIISHEIDERIEMLANTPMSMSLSLHDRFLRWLTVYENGLSTTAVNEFKKLLKELECE